MKIMFSTTYDAKYEELAKIVIPNHLEYCRTNNYSYNVHHCKHEEINFNTNLTLVRRMLPSYDAVVSIDLDLLFMDMKWKIEKEVCDTITIGDEYLGEGGSLINAGVVLWPKNEKTAAVLDNLIGAWPVFQKEPGNWQTQLYLMEKEMPGIINIIPASRINAQAKQGYKCSWNQGMPIAHMYCMPIEDKIELSKSFLKMVKQ